MRLHPFDCCESSRLLLESIAFQLRLAVQAANSLPSCPVGCFLFSFFFGGKGSPLNSTKKGCRFVFAHWAELSHEADNVPLGIVFCLYLVFAPLTARRQESARRAQLATLELHARPTALYHCSHAVPMRLFEVGVGKGTNFHLLKQVCVVSPCWF